MDEGITLIVEGVHMDTEFTGRMQSKYKTRCMNFVIGIEGHEDEKDYLLRTSNRHKDKSVSPEQN